MVALKEPERITLAEGLTLLERHVPTTEEAKSRLRQAFIQKAFRQEPLFAFSYDEADIDWMTGSVKIPRKRDRFCPTFSRAEFNAYFFEEEPLRARAGRDEMVGRQPHTALLTTREDARQRLKERIDEATAIIPGRIETQSDLSEAQEKERKWRAYNRELLRRMFTTEEYARDYERSQIFPDRHDNNMFNITLTLRESIKKQVARLESIIERLELIEEVSATRAEASVAQSRSKVFVVHGHDEGALQAMARFLEKIGLQAIVLREQPDQGLTTIEKFEASASEVGFAVVLLTPDDLGGAVAAPEQAARVRQNVIFELGYFVGRLGRGRACLLRKGEVEIPSDLVGVIYTDMDHPAEGWKVKLARELKAAQFEFDADKVVA